MNGEEAGVVYDTVSHLSRQLRLAQAELALYKLKYGEALNALKRYDPECADAIDDNDDVVPHP